MRLPAIVLIVVTTAVFAAAHTSYWNDAGFYALTLDAMLGRLNGDGRATTNGDAASA